jgi:hypothetical protein
MSVTVNGVPTSAICTHEGEPGEMVTVCPVTIMVNEQLSEVLDIRNTDGMPAGVDIDQGS